MDRRQIKTRKAIFTAFRQLLETKRYDHITVQEILEKADIGRSTFYAHFPTKDHLLEAMCDDLFHHVFEYDPCPWVGHDTLLETKLAHILWHIRDSRNDLCGILLSDSSERLLRHFKTHLKTLFNQHLTHFTLDVPKGFLLNHLVGSFAETVHWWMRGQMTIAPETMAHYFLQLHDR
ncbi:MAG: TetR/AcrR family transcriptional regulator [Kiritimatiellae bacterium]|nr:TetR/AcrR family transcriptional regulator [Kiritimatiellia bacterium]